MELGDRQRRLGAPRGTYALLPQTCCVSTGKARREDEQEGAQQRRELSEPQTGDQGPPPAGQVGVQGAWSMLRMETSVCSPQVGVEGAWSTQRTER